MLFHSVSELHLTQAAPRSGPHGHRENSIGHGMDGKHTREDTAETQEIDKLQAAEILLKCNGEKKKNNRNKNLGYNKYDHCITTYSPGWHQPRMVKGQIGEMCQIPRLPYREIFLHFWMKFQSKKYAIVLEGHPPATLQKMNLNR